MISGKNLSWKYKSQKGSSPILKEVSFSINKGRITTFMGPSGAGKTTLLKCIANLHCHYEGMITFHEKDLKGLEAKERASAIGFVLQQFHLFPHLNVLKNCTYALIEVLGYAPTAAEEKAKGILAALNMLPFIHSHPSQLSGGQQQRVAIARALALNPEILLLDEPTSALDPESKKDLESILLDLKAKGMTIALSSHDMPFIRKIKDMIYFMEEGELIEAWDETLDSLSSKPKISHFLNH